MKTRFAVISKRLGAISNANLTHHHLAETRTRVSVPCFTPLLRAGFRIVGQLIFGLLLNAGHATENCCGSIFPRIPALIVA